MTKHGFLDKIKAAAKTNRSDEPAKVSKDGTTPDLDQGTNKSSWSALQDDYMLDPKKVSQLIISLNLNKKYRNNYCVMKPM